MFIKGKSDIIYMLSLWDWATALNDTFDKWEQILFMLISKDSQTKQVMLFEYNVKFE